MISPHLTGRIIRGVGGNYTVVTPDGRQFVCQARGLFRKHEITPLVGDMVEISNVDESQLTGYLQEILPRSTELVRPRVANVDQVIVVCAVRPVVNLPMLDAFVINCEMQGVDAVLCINKVDLCDVQSYAELSEMYGMAGYKTLAVSAETGVGLDGLTDVLTGKTTIFAGPSGVGKSSILNRLYPHLELATGGLSEKIGRGKHTTRHTQLITVERGTYVVDSPGFTSITIDKIPKNELAEYYPEFTPYLGTCFFAKCTHVQEPDCAVKEQIGQTIHPARYQLYKNFMEATK
ncbi:MAG: ribosome small subunit-dependent GTPase A [Defluviitaleaceae bacterium]|nr:ribosome small subunit-dependent GTPase A [Defluviitaleaceae bacterium]